MIYGEILSLGGLAMRSVVVGIGFGTFACVAFVAWLGDFLSIVICTAL